MRNSSLVFMNSDPVVDFPKLTSPRVIDIGGISVHGGHDELDEVVKKIATRVFTEYFDLCSSARQ